MDAQIIKSADRTVRPAAPLRGIVPRKAQEAYAQAELIVDAAHDEAAAILERARTEAENDKEQARQDGYRNGLAQWTEAVLRAAERENERLRDGERQVVLLASAIAEKIVGEQLRLEPSGIVTIVRDAMQSVRREKSLTIQVHPDHVGVVRERLSELQQALGGTREFQVVAGASVTVGGCVVESEFGVIDARLEVQLEVLREALLKVVKR